MKLALKPAARQDILPQAAYLFRSMAEKTSPTAFWAPLKHPLVDSQNTHIPERPELSAIRIFQEYDPGLFRVSPIFASTIFSKERASRFCASCTGAATSLAFFTRRELPIPRRHVEPS